uniref:Nitrate transporter 1.7 n=1 Tax=Lygus hesperus TaxID=30085 RepID=A0A0A9XCF4_LYGHE
MYAMQALSPKDTLSTNSQPFVTVHAATASSTTYVGALLSRCSDARRVWVSTIASFTLLSLSALTIAACFIPFTTHHVTFFGEQLDPISQNLMAFLAHGVPLQTQNVVLQLVCFVLVGVGTIAIYGAMAVYSACVLLYRYH